MDDLIDIYDVAVVGAGINGSTAANFLAAEGYHVLLIDKGDLGGAATGRSGRTVHSGLQLLAPKSGLLDYARDPCSFVHRLSLARRAAEDYVELCTEAPNRLRSMEIAVPIYKGASYRGWHVDIGARLLQLLGGPSLKPTYRRHLPHTCSSNPFATEFREQGKITSIFSFVDQFVDWPERIAIDAALEAESRGASVRNFTELRLLTRETEFWRLDLLHHEQPSVNWTTRAKVVVNTAGAWVDRIIERTSVEVTPAATKVRPVKGVYMMVRLPSRFKGHGIASLNRVGEPITCLPWGDLHYIGPTETIHDGNLDDVVPETDDVEFLLAEYNYLMPGMCIGREDILMAWAGVRPITHASGFPKGSRLALNVLHDLGREGYPHMLALTWGTFANHRSTGRAILEAVRRRISPSATTQSEAHEHLDTRSDIAAASRYSESSLSDRFRFCLQHEHARDLVGVLFSRTGLAWRGDLTRRTIEVAAEAISAFRGWDETRRIHELAEFNAYLQRHHIISWGE